MNPVTIQKGLIQENQFIKKSAKDRLMQNLDLASNIKSDYRKLVKPLPIRKNVDTRNNTDEKLINSNIEPRISEIADKKDRTRLINQPYNTLSEEISVNPFYKNNITKVMVINSKFRDMTIEQTHQKKGKNFYNENINSSNFYLNLNYKLKNVISMRLLDICIPNNLFNVSESIGNNTILISNSSIPPSKYDVDEFQKFVIPDNKYTITDLITVINSLISSTNITLKYTTESFNSNINSAYLEFSNINIETEIIFGYKCENETGEPARTSSTLGYLLGFSRDYYDIESGAILNAESPPRLSNVDCCKYYYLMINDFNNNVNDYLIGNLERSFINKNILAKIIVENDHSSSCLIFKNDNFRQCVRNYFGPVDIDRFHIQLLNEYGNLVDLQGYDLNMSIEFKIQY